MSLQKPDGWLKFSAIIPDFQLWLQRMASDSKPVANALRLQREAYGRDDRQWFEWGHGSGTLPVVPVMVHGGYWRALHAADHRFVLPALSKLGVGVANIEYRLMPETRMEGLVADVVDAFEALSRRFPDARLLPLGHSAGAHLALAALGARRELETRLAGVVSVSGAFDLELVSRSFLQTELVLTGHEVERFSIKTAPQVPALFAFGSEETTPFPMQAEHLASTSAAACAVSVSRSHHMNVLHNSLTGDAPLLPLIRNWLAGETLPGSIEVRQP
ncbi:alpha/beta hydrolase fold domain-containing protein (plasmid) [Peteryoungia desertarenae]|uniref:Alpha/beta hydrolase fold domain-containing protein n=1 Tax=Peteryoungia desertarenae TaxID=1813451 RepID=A0ABX6QU76_9HYPH|nr:alpha/beta hydrolase fold domain-containing protein [Peteryoungia desertarenae]QLF71851.1 alpha/beta hydrolase fold domain-containing protein [Peteryoungia desertarenae]